MSSALSSLSLALLAWWVFIPASAQGDSEIPRMKRLGAGLQKKGEHTDFAEEAEEAPTYRLFSSKKEAREHLKGMGITKKGFYPELIKHIKAKDWNTAAIIVQAGVKMNRDAKEEGPLHLAAQYGNVEFLKLMIAHGAKVNTPCTRLQGEPAGTNLTPIFYAALAGNEENLRFLNEQGDLLETTSQDKNAWTLIRYAALSGSRDCVRFLVSWGMNPCKEFQDGTNALHYAVMSGNVELVHYLVNQGVSPNATHHRTGYTPAYYAAMKGNDEILALLLQNGANPRICRTSDRSTLLHHAAVHCSEELVQLIMMKGGSPYNHDINHRTPKDWARMHNRAEVFRKK